MRIAVMQPYAFPYLGYFRLLSQTDLFVLYDDVQHQRRGFVHRNRLLDRNGVPQWFTLPLAYAPQNVEIRALRFADDARARTIEQTPRFPAFQTMPPSLRVAVENVGGAFLPYCVRVMVECCKLLGVPLRMAYSSDLRIPSHIRGSARILEICRLTGATEYLNSPGGIGLYEPEAFDRAGVKLEFLPAWTGRPESVLQGITDGESHESRARVLPQERLHSSPEPV